MPITKPIECFDIETLKKYSAGFSSEAASNYVERRLDKLNEILEDIIKIKVVPYENGNNILLMNHTSKLSPEHVDHILASLTEGKVRTAHPHTISHSLMINNESGFPEFNIAEHAAKKLNQALNDIAEDIALKASQKISATGEKASTEVADIQKIIAGKAPVQTVLAQ